MKTGHKNKIEMAKAGAEQRSEIIGVQLGEVRAWVDSVKKATPRIVVDSEAARTAPETTGPDARRAWHLQQQRRQRHPVLVQLVQ